MTDDAARDEKIDWNADDHHQTWLLISRLTNDMVIKNGLFPPLEGISQQQMELALDAQQKEKIMAKGGRTAASQACKPWVDKIKNRLRVMCSTTARHIADMGQTGTGLDSADQIAEGTPLHTKWEQIKHTTPWFFEMKSLILECPNCTPIGLGHSGTLLDLSLLADSASSEAEGINNVWDNLDVDDDGLVPDPVSISSSGITTGMSYLEEDLPVALLDEVDKERSYAVKQKLELDDLSSPLPRAKATARPNSSKPAAPIPARNSKRSKIGGDIFAVAELEASTCNKELNTKLELEKARIIADANAKVELAKVNQEVLLEREKRKTEKYCQHHERFMLKYQSRAGPLGSTAAFRPQVPVPSVTATLMAPCVEVHTIVIHRLLSMKMNTFYLLFHSTKMPAITDQSTTCLHCHFLLLYSPMFTGMLTPIEKIQDTTITLMIVLLNMDLSLKASPEVQQSVHSTIKNAKLVDSPEVQHSIREAELLPLQSGSL
ncbi:hypothetical protein BDQ17DRAFT_1331755 [Cyathus striatus]|nr:hypothetical protein BDQ17DRAFT_1331755 [Cyathus striatus]